MSVVNLHGLSPTPSILSSHFKYFNCILSFAVFKPRYCTPYLICDFISSISTKKINRSISTEHNLFLRLYYVIQSTNIFFPYFSKFIFSWSPDVSGSNVFPHKSFFSLLPVCLLDLFNFYIYFSHLHPNTDIFYFVSTIFFPL